MALDHIENGDFSNSTSAQRGVCYICHCRKQDSDSGIFRGGNISYEGDLDICENCIRQGADQLGWISITKADQFRGMIAAQERDLLIAENLIKEQEKALKALGYIGEIKRSRLLSKVKVS